MTPESTLERDLTTLFVTDLSSAAAERLDDRLATAIDTSPVRLATIRRGRRRRRGIVAVGVAAVVVVTAASPPVREAFDRWFGGDFASVWDLATPIEQSVVDEGYRVTLVRAYADPVGVYLATTMEDLEGRDLEEAHAAMPRLVDDQGNEYPAFMGQGTGSGSSTYAEGLWRYRVPASAAVPGDRHFTAEVSSIRVRAVDPPDATDGFPYETLWSEIPGAWTFEFDLAVRGQLEAQPDVTASHAGIDVRWTDLVVTPAATIITLEVTGLEPTAKDWGWDQGGRIEHDGRRLEWFSSQGILDAGPEPQTIVYEMEQGREDLAGTWVITIDEFRTDIPDPDSNITTESKRVTGPWILTFEGPPAS